jgi:hypothetical protein
MSRLYVYRWHIAQVLAVLVLMASFFSWAPWLTAVPIAEVPVAEAQKLPAGCPAATNGHGKWVCFSMGTIQENPVGFWVCTVAAFGSWAFLIATSWSGRGLIFRRKRAV